MAEVDRIVGVGVDDRVGAVVEVTTSGSTQRWLVRAGGSYLSQSQVSPTFGLGDATAVDRVTVRWPSGIVQTVEAPPVNRALEIVERR